MQYQKNVKIVIDKRKLDTLVRLGVSDENLLSVIKMQRFEPTGDSLIDDYLSTLVCIKEFSNWGGNRKNSGRKPKNNQLENQDDFQLENQDDCNLDDKDIDKDKDKGIDMNKGVQGGKEKKGAFKKPTVEDVSAYCKERGNSVDPESFYDFYQSKGWRIGKEPMKDWKAAVRNWERRSGQYGGANAPATSEKKFDWEDDPNIVYDSETNTGSVEGVWYYHTWDFAKARMAYLKRKEEEGKNNG